jgi:hypothetical protein
MLPLSTSMPDIGVVFPVASTWSVMLLQIATAVVGVAIVTATVEVEVQPFVPVTVTV